MLDSEWSHERESSIVRLPFKRERESDNAWFTFQSPAQGWTPPPESGIADALFSLCTVVHAPMFTEFYFHWVQTESKNVYIVYFPCAIYSQSSLHRDDHSPSIMWFIKTNCLWSNISPLFVDELLHISAYYIHTWTRLYLYYLRHNYVGREPEGRVLFPDPLPHPISVYSWSLHSILHGAGSLLHICIDQQFTHRCWIYQYYYLPFCLSFSLPFPSLPFPPHLPSLLHNPFPCMLSCLLGGCLIACGAIDKMVWAVCPPIIWHIELDSR